jgi:hypothetical protein
VTLPFISVTASIGKTDDPRDTLTVGRGEPPGTSLAGKTDDERPHTVTAGRGELLALGT